MIPTRRPSRVGACLETQPVLDSSRVPTYLQSSTITHGDESVRRGNLESTGEIDSVMWRVGQLWEE